MARIEHPVGPGDADSFNVRLEQAFAPMAMMTGNGEERFDLFPFAAVHRRFLVLGGPGTGKTTLMKSLVMGILNGRCHEELNPLIPVFVVLREMATAGLSVEQAIVAALGKLRFKKAEKFVSVALDHGSLLIILDGLDEVGANRAAISGRIREFCLQDEQRDHKNRLIVTCRENSYRIRDLADVISTVTRVEPFTPQHMRTFLQGWPSYKGRVALGLYPQIQADPQILDICRNPLLLTLLTGLYLDKDKFDLPSSRDKFYFTAIDELLVQRPARKQQQQDYTEQHKWRILQQIALDRLETVSPDEDPEILSRERLFDSARQVLGSDLKEPDFQRLLDELDRVNSIIKPTGDEGDYVLGHRTFQEYLAAREANRTRKTAQIIAHFSGRPELAEVLCFYCGLIGNIPQIDSVLEKLVEAGDTLLAGRCLLNVVETPSGGVVATIVESLFDTVRTSRAYATELDMLSSLAQRPPKEFDIARQRFSGAIEFITGTSGEGSSGFVSALSANPALAVKLIPGLLNHNSANWRMQAVLLLHNIGTDDALQQLVHITTSSGEPERVASAILISSLIRARNSELRQMAGLFPERAPDRRLWPFESYFPGRIALAILDALEHAGSSDSIKNRCIAEAWTKRRIKPIGKWDLHCWQNVSTYMKLNSYRRRAVRMLNYALFAIVTALFLGVIGLQIFVTVKQRAALMEFWPPRVAIIPNRPILDLYNTASGVYEQIRRRYPPSASGFSRILPWNWETKPLVPPNAHEPIEDLGTFANCRCGFQMSASDWETRWDAVYEALSVVTASSTAVSALKDAEQAVRRTLPKPSSRWGYAWLVGQPLNKWTTPIFFVNLVLMPAYFLFMGRRIIRRMNLASSPGRDYSHYGVGMATGVVAVAMQTFIERPLLLLSTLAVVFLVFTLVQLSGLVDFPPNPYMKLVEELQPITKNADASTPS